MIFFHFVTWLDSVGSSACLASALSHMVLVTWDISQCWGTEMASHIWLTVGGSFWLRYLFFFFSFPHGSSVSSRLNSISQQSIWILREQIWQFPSLFENNLKTGEASFLSPFTDLSTHADSLLEGEWSTMLPLNGRNSRYKYWKETFLEPSASYDQ